MGREDVPSDRPIRVVIADDDDDLRNLLAEYLRQPPFELVGAAADADEAVQLAREHVPDAALLDVNMPGGGARRVVDELRSEQLPTAAVILSGLDEDHLVRGILQAGAIAYLVKGASREEILDVVRKAVSARERLEPS